METWQAINTVRVVRKFSDEPITDEHLDRILNAGRRTGSSKNDQHWAFIVCRDREHLRELALCHVALADPQIVYGRTVRARECGDRLQEGVVRDEPARQRRDAHVDVDLGH